MRVKRFLEWIGLKEKLHLSLQQAPYVSEGQVWWASLGENIGFEIDGKSNQFTRPVIIFKKLSNGFYFVIPLTSRFRLGSWYVSCNLKGMEQIACLHQVRAIDYRRLYSKLGRLDDLEYKKVKEGFVRLYL